MPERALLELCPSPAVPSSPLRAVPGLWLTPSLTNADRGDKFVKICVPAPPSSNRNSKPLQSIFGQSCWVLQAGTPKALRSVQLGG